MASVDQPLRIALLAYRGKPHCGGQGVYVRHLSKALVDLGHTLGMEIVAEGIELACQLTQLRTLQCERGQGYLFDRPLVPAAAAARVAALAAGDQPCGVGPPVTRSATRAGPA